jgi:ribonucleoside-diphosphate reductase alpha chain
MAMTNVKESPRPGLAVATAFAHEGVDPFDEVDWEERTARIRDERGDVIWEQAGCMVPSGWSQLATDVVASKYFYGDPDRTLPGGACERENSVRQLVARVCRTIAAAAANSGVFACDADAMRFREDLKWLCLNQRGAFNSPVWFNMGLYHEYGISGAANNWIWSEDEGRAVPCADSYRHPQGSACFIQSVGDDMGSIMKLAASEAMLFKYGSGTGTDLSTLRSCREKVSGGGKASGPVSFMAIYDAIASVVKSGGKTRRAAKMQTLKCWHPDILEFIECKAKEGQKERVLLNAGYPPTMTGSLDEASSSVRFQNANLSVRLTDQFIIQASRLAPATGPVKLDWQTRPVLPDTRARMPAYNACHLMGKIAEGTWLCGDPGVQYEDTIQRWHTCPNTAPINSSNPCSEYMFIDDSACNLASLNFMLFRREDGTIDTMRLRAAARTFIVAQETIVDAGSYPTAEIAENSHRFRPLGLGFCNLGALLMSRGLPYDSDGGRSLAGALSALLCGQAYVTSAEMAGVLGPFEGFAANRESMLRVIGQHLAAAVKGRDLSRGDFGVGTEVAAIWDEAVAAWEAALEYGREAGFRNSQVTVIAPTGTIAFMMDADTTGIEPDIALVKYKNLAGGGQLKIVNRTVAQALSRLGYSPGEARAILAHIDRYDTIEDVIGDDGVIARSGLAREHLPVFDCAFRPTRGTRSIAWEGHMRMMAAVQPFVSGAISKTVNMPADATVETIYSAYMLGWKLGLKALAIYRDGSKGNQPLTTGPAVEDERDTALRVFLETDAGRAYAAVAGQLAEYRGAPVAHGDVPEVVAGMMALARSAGQPTRRHLPETRQSLTHKFVIHSGGGDAEGYITVGFYNAARTEPGEVFITMAKEGSTVGGLTDALGTMISIGLQYGVPLETLVRKFAHSRFEPSGFTNNPDIPIAKSVIDYIFTWLGMELIPGYREENAPRRDRMDGTHEEEPGPAAARNGAAPAVVGAVPARGPRRMAASVLVGPTCTRCQTVMVPAGRCFYCPGCGADSGGCG